MAARRIPLALQRFPRAPQKHEAITPIKKWKLYEGDLVQVNSGRCKGQQAEIKQILKATNQVILDGVNMVRIVSGDNP